MFIYFRKKFFMATTENIVFYHSEETVFRFLNVEFIDEFFITFGIFLVLQ